MSAKRAVRAAALALAASLAAAALPAQVVTPVAQGFDVQAPLSPALVEIGGVPQLVYELHLTNFASRPILLDRFDILAGNAVIGGAEGDALAGWIEPVGPGTERRQVQPGARAILYVNLPIEAGPTAVGHRLSYRRLDEAGPAPGQLILGPTAVARTAMLVLGPPLRGGLWAAVYDPAMTRGHRRVVYATEGAARIPGRFAIDWFRVDEQGRMARGDGARVDQHLGHGAEVIAVADGIVVATRDDMMEPETLAAAPRVPIGDATGNYVAIDIGGVYAFYEHLRPGLAVRPGERVRRGQRIGRLGFTGQASSPHLHFHLADAPSPLGAEGLAYLIQGIEPIGRFASIEAFGRGDGWAPLPPRTGNDRPYFPAANMVVRFPER